MQSAVHDPSTKNLSRTGIAMSVWRNEEFARVLSHRHGVASNRAWYVDVAPKVRLTLR
jgi:hypothetical protein